METSPGIKEYPKKLRVTDELELRLATPEDTDNIVAWTQNRDVYTWWEGRPLSREEVAEKYVGERTPSVIVYIIEENQNPCGLIQAWQEAGKRGIDMFLSSESQGKGIGAVVARALAEGLLAMGWDNISVDPSVENDKAIKSWEKAGFKATGEYGEDNGHVTKIMVFKKSGIPISPSDS